MLILLLSSEIFSQTGRVFQEGEKSPYSLLPGDDQKTSLILLGAGGQSTDFESKYHPILSLKYELRHSFWYKKENFDWKRIGFSVASDLFLRKGNDFMLTFPITYTYGNSFTLFIGPGFLNKERINLLGNEEISSRVSILAIKFGLAYDFRIRNFVIRPSFNEDFFGNSTSYQFSLLFGLTFL